MALMASQISFSSNRPRDPNQQKHAIFDEHDYIPAEVLIQIKNHQEAKELSYFFYEKKEKITGITLNSDGTLSKVYTVSQDNITKIWGKKLMKSKGQYEKEGEKFFICAEMKRPLKPAVVSPAPSAAID